METNQNVGQRNRRSEMSDEAYAAICRVRKTIQAKYGFRPDLRVVLSVMLILAAGQKRIEEQVIQAMDDATIHITIHQSR